MLVMRTTKDPANSVGELVSSQQSVGFYDLALAVYPLGLYGIEPRTLLGQQAAHYPHCAPALFEFSVVRSEPAPDLFGDVPAGVVPDENQHSLACRLELLATSRKEARGYGTHRPPIHEPQPPLLVEFGQIQAVAGYGLRLGVIFGYRALEETLGLAFLAPATQSRQRYPAPPALVQETHRPRRTGLGEANQSVAASFFLSYKGSGEVIQRFARCHFTPRRRKRVARIVSPETRLCVIPSSKATSAAIESVQRLVSRPNSLGERCSSALKASALSSSKASRVLRGREDLAARAPTPLALKSWMASRTVCCPQPRFSAICGTSFPFEEARSICERRRVKASLERSPAWRVSRSFSESERTKIGVFMATTVTHNPKSILKMH